MIINGIIIQVAILYLSKKLYAKEGDDLMNLVIVESPYKANDYHELELNMAYARSALRDCLLRGEAPYASHLLYTQDGVLNDEIPEERTLGIDAGLEWGKHAKATVVYVDRGISTGMNYGIANAINNRRPVFFRSLSNDITKFSIQDFTALGLNAGASFLLKDVIEMC